MRPQRWPWAAAAIVVIAVLLEAWSRRTPAPRDASAPLDAFSAARALAVEARLLGDGAPHPVASVADAAVRERIIDELRAIGLAPEKHASYVCRRNAVCAPVVNVLARIPGRSDAPPLALVSHYDSVHAGPGAGDDMHGVAVMLEVARILVAARAPGRPIILLFDEGEEVGLLGAEAFVRGHPWASEVGLAINVEARGTTGRTSLFESSEGNAELVAAYAAAAPSPEGSSLAVEVYRRMPNDTDFTVLREAGVAGINLAFIGGVARYHTPLDDLAHLDAGSVQHQGDTVLAVARAFAESPLVTSAGDAAFTDLLGRVVIRWPTWWTIPILVACALLLLGVAVVARRDGSLRIRGLVLALPSVLVVLLVGAAAGIALVEGVALAIDGEAAAVAEPLPLRIAAWAAVGVGTCASAALLGRWIRGIELGLATLLVWSSLGIVACAEAPGVAPAFVLPVVPSAIAAAFALAPADRSPRPLQFALSVGLAAFAVVWSSLAFGLEDAFGWGLAPAVILPIAVAALPAAWAFAGPEVARARRAVLASAALVAASCALAAVLVGVHDADAPRHVRIVHHVDADTGTAVLAAYPGDRPLPARVRNAAAFASAPEPVLPGTSVVAWVAPSQTDGRPAPELVVLSRESGRIRMRLDAPWADRAALLVDDRSRVRMLEVGGERAGPPDGEGPLRLDLFGLVPEGVVIELEPTGAPPAVRVVACGPALPSDAVDLVRVRNEVAVTQQWGDSACVSRTIAL